MKNALSEVAEPASKKNAEKTSQLPSLTTLRRLTVSSLLRTWNEIKGTARHVIWSELDPSLPKSDMEYLHKQMRLCLDTPGGEITARANTAELGRTYLGLNETGRARFLKMLASDFDVDERKLSDLTFAYTQSNTADERFKLEMDLRQVLTSPRSTILRQFTALPDGFKFLVNMRADLLPLIGKDQKLKGLEYDLKTILSSWFDVGLLDLVEITWNSPAALLEKLIEYEAVHRVTSWEDLKNRLDADRRVFAFIHNKMPMEPLIFVHVALVEGMSDNVQKLLDTKSPVFNIEKADTAIFYSISNAQKGLAGISFGNFLIKRVVNVLSSELKQLTTFATLSPVPGFRAWLDPLLAKDEAKILLPDEVAILKKLNKDAGAGAALLSILESEWVKDKKLAEAIKPILMRLCAHYLIEEKKNGKPLDPVASFHLFNGARLERMNWLGDTSAKGLKQSAGLMVNYHYRLSKIDENHEEFATNGKVVASRPVRGYLR
jgi:malonyl-CoA decarboxylase